MTIDQTRKAIADTSVVSVVTEALHRAKHESCHAFLELTDARALTRAHILDKKIANGENVGPLAGVPFVAKDNMLTFESHTTAASTLLENFTAPFQAEAVERLEAAGAICIGKANLDAFAHGGSTENSAFGPTLNPHDETRVAGGSSGGSAAVVALGIVPFSLGTDTGGSIREPASFCGVVGFKPSYGSVSRYGVVAMASSTDVIGPLTTTIDDSLEVMRVIAGRDTKDSTTIESVYTDSYSTSLKRVGVVKEWMGNGVSTEVQKAVQTTIDSLDRDGYKVSDVSLPMLSYALAAYYIIVPAEVASNLARYDGIRYGVRPEDTLTLDSVYNRTRSEGFMPENMRRIMIGNYVLSSGYYDAYFQKAAKIRTLIINELNTAFETYDFLVGPTVPTTAFKLGENTHDPLSMYLADQMTVSASLAGIPAVSIPVANDGLPVGFQVMGRQTEDVRLLDFAKVVEGYAV